MTSVPLLNFWSKRSLIFHLALMNIKIRFKGTYLGFTWIALEPTLTFLVLYVVFTSIRITERENFGVYLLTGVFLYHIFVRGTMGGLTSLRGNKGIIESLNIQKEIFPTVSTFATALLVLVEVVMFFVIIMFFGFMPTWTIVFLPIILGLLILLILGLSYFLSVIHVYIPDIQPIWAVFTHAVFFVSPIFWFLEDTQGIVLEFHKFNPVGQLIELAHKVVVFGQVPELTEWLYSVFFILAIFIIGITIFRKFEARVVQEL